MPYKHGNRQKHHIAATNCLCVDHAKNQRPISREVRLSWNLKGNKWKCEYSAEPVYGSRFWASVAVQSVD